MRSASFLALMLWAAAAPAQTTMYKCMGERNQVTYSNITCEKQGLKSAGAVTADRVTTMPSMPTQGSGQLPTQRLKPPVEMPKENRADSKDAEVDRAGAQLRPVNPLIEKLAK
jgi:hypothetical protein